jgi:hypothetical protein
VCELVRDQVLAIGGVWRILAGAEVDVAAMGECIGPHCSGLLGGMAVMMQADGLGQWNLIQASARHHGIGKCLCLMLLGGVGALPHLGSGKAFYHRSIAKNKIWIKIPILSLCVNQGEVMIVKYCVLFTNDL